MKEVSSNSISPRNDSVAILKNSDTGKTKYEMVNQINLTSIRGTLTAIQNKENPKQNIASMHKVFLLDEGTSPSMVKKISLFGARLDGKGNNQISSNIFFYQKNGVNYTLVKKDENDTSKRYSFLPFDVNSKNADSEISKIIQNLNKVKATGELHVQYNSKIREETIPNKDILDRDDSFNLSSVSQQTSAYNILNKSYGSTGFIDDVFSALIDEKKGLVTENEVLKKDNVLYIKKYEDAQNLIKDLESKAIGVQNIEKQKLEDIRKASTNLKQGFEQEKAILLQQKTQLEQSLNTKINSLTNENSNLKATIGTLQNEKATLANQVASEKSNSQWYMNYHNTNYNKVSQYEQLQSQVSSLQSQLQSKAQEKKGVSIKVEGNTGGLIVSMDPNCITLKDGTKISFSL